MLKCTVLTVNFKIAYIGISMSPEHGYDGLELELFKSAKNWTGYLAHAIRPHLKGHVLEIGAGIGGFTRAFCLEIRPNQVDSWWCLEPDPKQTAIIQNDIDRGILPAFCMATVGTLDSLPNHQKFDTILYVDVLNILKMTGRSSRIRPHI